MYGLSARLPTHNDPTRIFEGEVVEAGIALHGLSSLMMTCESTVTCSQIAALIESIVSFRQACLTGKNWG